ncbi:hypothetical protein [Herbaspirillum huttiense]|uniref:hypothetical protein n=1 Tax=Herbaspirillum huttiense TaxID=863372 RepID=UPI002176DDEA|nr:hypothetical protein [Herbaspirillum huttiense]UWE18072.1 hypothetical protein NY669_07830 [Herbaspirillum huttiense]
MTAVSIILLLAVIAPLGFYVLGKSTERSEVRMAAMAADPLPPLPMQFAWRSWGLAVMAIFWLALWIPFNAVLFAAMLYASQSYKVGPISILFFLLLSVFLIVVTVISVSHLLDLVRLYFAGVAFSLTSDGISYAGDYFYWDDISAIRYETSGKGGSSVVFALQGRKVMWFRILQRSYISVPTIAIKDPDGLVGYARRLLVDSKKNGTSSHFARDG